MGSTPEKETINNTNKQVINQENINQEKNKILKGSYESRLEVEKKDPLDFYDMIIDINSFSTKNELIWNIETKQTKKEEQINLENQIEINQNQNQKSNNEIQDKKKNDKINLQEENIQKKEIGKDNNIVIGVIGLGNVGKSYLLSLFLGEDLPTGDSIHTKGISIKKSDKLIILDSEGMEAPLTRNNVSKDFYQKDNLAEKEINESDFLIQAIARDKKAVELFIQDFIIEKSDILFIIVGQLTLTEQKLINRIINETNKEKIFVIHNLKNLYTKTQIDNYIKDTFKKNIFFNDIIELEYKGNNDIGNIFQNIENKTLLEEYNKYYIEKPIDKSKKGAIHLIMASNVKESEAYYYNKTAFDYVRTEIMVYNKGKKFDVLEELKKFLVKKSERFAESEEMNKVPYTKEDITIEEKDGSKYIKIKNKAKLKKCLINQLGFSSFYGTLFSPNYICYIDKDKDKENEEKFIIEINTCGQGFTFDNIKREEITEDGHKIIISITGKKKLKEYNIIETISSSTMDSGNFRIDIVLDGKKFKFKNTKVVKKKGKGITKFCYSLLNKDEINKNETKEINFKEIKKPKEKPKEKEVDKIN